MSTIIVHAEDVIEGEMKAASLHCPTKVVEELLYSVIVPNVLRSTQLQIRGEPIEVLSVSIAGNCFLFSRVSSGILLTGPPGVGKTYSVRAAQALCKDWCKVSQTVG